MTKREQRDAAEILERLAGIVAAGEVTAGPGFVGRVEGAAEALEVLGRSRQETRRSARRA